VPESVMQHSIFLLGSCDDKGNEAVLRWMADETRELDSCGNGTRLPHGALVWLVARA
jgi:hypothetical protein